MRTKVQTKAGVKALATREQIVRYYRLREWFCMLKYGFPAWKYNDVDPEEIILELTAENADFIINDLSGKVEWDEMWNDILRMLTEMGYITGKKNEEDYEMDIAKLNKFFREHGTPKKELKDMDLGDVRGNYFLIEMIYESFKRDKRPFKFVLK